MSQPPFTMSKYASETELLRDKCAWLERQLADSTGYAEQFARHIASQGVGHPSGDPRVLMCIECGAKGRNRPTVAHTTGCIVGKAQAVVAALSKETDADREALARGEIPAHIAQPTTPLGVSSVKPVELLTDGNRIGCEEYATGIYVRAKGPGGRWGSYDIAELQRDSLIAWLRSRGEKSEWAEQTVLILLDYTHTPNNEADPDEVPSQSSVKPIPGLPFADLRSVIEKGEPL